MAVEGLGELQKAFSEMFAKMIPQNQQAIVAKIALEGFSKIVKKTPVDTGRARANWSVTVGKPASIATDSTDKADFGDPPASNRTTESNVVANNTTHGQTIFVTNALPYIDALENGHSKQGAHMVELSVNELKSTYGI